MSNTSSTQTGLWNALGWIYSMVENKIVWTHWDIWRCFSQTILHKLRSLWTQVRRTYWECATQDKWYGDNCSRHTIQTCGRHHPYTPPAQGPHVVLLSEYYNQKLCIWSFNNPCALCTALSSTQYNNHGALCACRCQTRSLNIVTSVTS